MIEETIRLQMYFCVYVSIAISSLISNIEGNGYFEHQMNTRGKSIGKRDLLPTKVNPDQQAVYSNSSLTVRSVHYDYYTLNNYTQMPELEFDNYWFDIDKYVGSDGNWTGMHHLSLANRYRAATKLSLPFAFPFYGNEIYIAVLSTGGFLFMEDTIHSWLTATQYVAPLMAGFATYLNDSEIKTAFNATTYVVEWNNVILKGEPNREQFVFQVVLYFNGNIQFNYKNIPIPVAKIKTNEHPQKSGIADAYATQAGMRQTIYEYHRIKVSDDMILNRSVIMLTAQPTCVSAKTIDECHSVNNTAFNCIWCIKNETNADDGICSDDKGMNRMRSLWKDKQCLSKQKMLMVVSESKTDQEMVNATGAPRVDTVDYDFYTVNHLPEMTELEFRNHWFDVEELVGPTYRWTGMFHYELSHKYRQGTETILPFSFPFYGKEIHKVVIATGGFLYLGARSDELFSTTQYVAPLMANFITQLNDSEITSAFNGFAYDTTYVVQWNNVVLKEASSRGPFTFQVALYINGNIQFNYKNIPMPVDEIRAFDHEQAAGLADAYENQTSGRRMMHEYHRINISDVMIVDRSVIYLIAKPTCMSAKSFDECRTIRTTAFECSWCMGNETNMEDDFCSDDKEMHRMSSLWETSGCQKLEADMVI